MSTPPPPLLPESDSSPSVTTPRLPWEERDRLGFVEAMVQTVRLLVTEPSEAFSRLRSDGDLTSPMLFGIMVSWICLLFSQLWSVLISSSVRGLFGGMNGFEELFRTPSGLGLAGMMLLWPVMFVVMAFVGAGVLHVCLMLVGATERSEQGFEGTLKVYIYATVSWFALLLPFVGGLLASLWHLVLQVVGFTAVHRTTQGRALIAVLIPTIVCCLCILGTTLVFGAVIYELVERLMQQGGLR
jgi:hypothetical protein